MFCYTSKPPFEVVRTLCQLSGVSTPFRCITPVYQVYHLCLDVAHRNTGVNGGNFIANCHKIVILLSNLPIHTYFWPGCVYSPCGGSRYLKVLWKFIQTRFIKLTFDGIADWSKLQLVKCFIHKKYDLILPKI